MKSVIIKSTGCYTHSDFKLNSKSYLATATVTIAYWLNMRIKLPYTLKEFMTMFK